MTCKNCNREIDAYIMEGKELYCPVCFFTIHCGTAEFRRIKGNDDYRIARNYVPDMDIIGDIIRQERERKYRHEQRERQAEFERRKQIRTVEPDLFHTTVELIIY
jgi:hypothetical protein